MQARDEAHGEDLVEGVVRLLAALVDPGDQGGLVHAVGQRGEGEREVGAHARVEGRAFGVDERCLTADRDLAKGHAGWTQCVAVEPGADGDELVGQVRGVACEDGEAGRAGVALAAGGDGGENVGSRRTRVDVQPGRWTGCPGVGVRSA